MAIRLEKTKNGVAPIKDYILENIFDTITTKIFVVILTI